MQTHADARHLAKVERRAGDAPDLSRQHLIRSHRQERCGGEFQLVIFDRRPGLAAQIEIGMLGEVEGVARSVVALTMIRNVFSTEVKYRLHRTALPG